MIGHRRNTSPRRGPGGRADGTEKGNGISWQYLYFLLAAFNVLTICGTLWLSDQARTIFRESIAEDMHWAEHIHRMTTLVQLTIDVNAPGNDVFESGDIGQEKARLSAGMQNFDRLLTAIRKDLSAEDVEGKTAILLARLDVVEVEVAKICQEANRVFSGLADGRRDQARSNMAAMDLHFATALTEIGKVTQDIQSVQSAQFEREVERASFLRQWEFVIGAVVMVIVGLVTWYGYALAQQMKKQKRIADERFHLSTILESSASSIFTIDGQGKILSFNKAAIETFGYQSDEMLGRNISMLMPSPEREKHDGYLLRYLNSGKMRVMGMVREETACRKDGTTFPIELSVYDVSQSTDGEDDRMYTGMIRDISEAKQRERELQLAYDEAQLGTKAKSEFLANMSHEIRTPMTAILGFTEVMLDNVTDEENIRSLTTIQSNGKYLLGLINDVLDLSKIEAGKLVVEKKACSAAEIVSDVVSLMRNRIEEKNLALRVHVDSDLPKAILTDPSRLRQILINLVGNAVKFTEVGGIEIDVRLVYPEESRKPKIHFSITDTGIGMSPSQIDRLFKPFSQVDSSTTRRFGGTGLGLSISHRLAGQLGGNISVTSTPGEGSTFTLTLVVESPKNAALPSGRSTASPSTAQPPTSDRAEDLHGRRILLAEDGVDNQRIISFFLKKEGALVTIAENGQVACEQAISAGEQGTPFDAIVMDMQMPVLDGYDATRRLREAGYQGAIVALTAHAMVGDRAKCLDAGCDGYETKPIDRRRLVETIGRCIAGREAEVQPTARD